MGETTCELLSCSDHNVREAPDTMEGLEKVKLFKPDSIFFDIMMPILDCYYFMGKHNNFDYSNIPVIFLTAKIELKDREKGNALRIKGHLKNRLF